jgi:hypothetical protein
VASVVFGYLGMAVMVILARAMAAAVTAEMGITYHP